MPNLLSSKPGWVRQKDFDLANQQLGMGGEAEQNMRRFLAAIASQNPSADDQMAIERRLQSIARSPAQESEDFIGPIFNPPMNQAVSPTIPGGSRPTTLMDLLQPMAAQNAQRNTLTSLLQRTR